MIGIDRWWEDDGNIFIWKNGLDVLQRLVSAVGVSSAMKTLDLGISGGGVPEGKPISAVTVDVDGGSNVELVSGVLLGSGTLLVLEGNAAPDV